MGVGQHANKSKCRESVCMYVVENIFSLHAQRDANRQKECSVGRNKIFSSFDLKALAVSCYQLVYPAGREKKNLHIVGRGPPPKVVLKGPPTLRPQGAVVGPFKFYP